MHCLLINIIYFKKSTIMVRVTIMVKNLLIQSSDHDSNSNCNRCKVSRRIARAISGSRSFEHDRYAL